MVSAALKISYNYQIPTLQEEADVAKDYYREAFSELPDNATFTDVDKKIRSQGNSAWFAKWPNYYDKLWILPIFPIPDHEEDPEHAIFHLLTGSPHTAAGELQVLTAQDIFHKGFINLESFLEDYSQNLKTIKNFHIISATYNHEDSEGSIYSTHKYNADYKLNSEENLPVCRVLFNSIFALEEFKHSYGKPLSEVLSHGGSKIPEQHLKPNDIMFDTAMNYVVFTKDGLKANENLDLPQTTIKLINKTCAYVNGIVAGGTVPIN